MNAKLNIFIRGIVIIHIHYQIHIFEINHDIIYKSDVMLIQI